MCTDPTPPDSVRIAAVDPTEPDALWCLEQYYAELERVFDGGFDLGRSLAPDPRVFAPPRGAFLLATRGGRPVGCGALKLEDSETAYIKRMWLDDSVRGLGLGRRLLEELEHTARALGCTTAQLETNRALTAAIALYRRAGYDEVEAFNDEPHAHHWFTKAL